MDNVLEMAALGRPFSLGMLYDCRSDMIVPGVTLWDRSELDSIKTVKDQSTTKCSVITGNEEEDKFESLGISADLKLSVMSGQVKVSGAAKYLNRKNYTKKLLTVTHHYEAVRKFEQMNMEQLGVGQMKHLNILDSCTATHVVTGILYGADVFLEFSTSTENIDANQNIQGNLNILIQNISSLTVGGKGAINVDEKQRSLANQLKCSFDGDIAMSSPPTTFYEAVEIYKQLPELVGDGKQKRIWLYPLVKLDSRAQTLVRHISDGVVGRVANYMGFLVECQARANDLKSEDACQKFYRLKSQLATFCDQIKDCDSKFKSEILPILPKIRGGSAEECQLLAVLRKFQESQFSDSGMWLDYKEKEISLLNSHCKSLKDILFATEPGALKKFVNSLDYEFVYALAFSLGGISDFYLEARNVFLENPSTSEYQQELSNEPWIKNVAIKNRMMVATKYFTQAAKNNRDKRVKFIVTEKLQRQPTGGVLMLYNGASGRPFDIPGPPSQPVCTKFTDTTVSLEWNFSDFGKENILGSEIYMLAYDQDQPAWQLAKQIQDSEASAIISNLTPNTKYKFKITPLCIINQGLESPASETIKTEPKTSQQLECEKREEFRKPNRKPKTELAKTEWEWENRTAMGIGKSELTTANSHHLKQQRLAEKLVQKSLLMKPSKNGCPTQYLLPTKEIFRDNEKNIAKVIIGNEAPNSSTDQILMLMGATGAGKTTLINAFANYYYGVKWEDEFRFLVIKEKELTQTKSQTKTITAYSFEPMEGAAVPYRTIIVDTPGFGDTAGLEEDKKTVEKIRHFFSKPGNEGITHLNGVGFVVQSPLARLTPSQKFVFDQVLAIFGKNMERSIFLMITFADGQDPPVIEAINKAGIIYQDEYRFNNSALFAKNTYSNKEEATDFAQMFWKMGQSTMKNFFTKFRMAPLVSLSMTIEVLNLRNQITTALEGLNKQITMGLGYLEEIQKEKSIMEIHRAEIEGGKDFEYTVEETQFEKKSIAGTGTFVTHCLKCNFTCHYPCKLPDSQKEHCYTMFWDYAEIAKDMSKALGKLVNEKNLNNESRTSKCICNVVEGEKTYCRCWKNDANKAMVEDSKAMFAGKYQLKHIVCGSCPGKCHHSNHNNVEYTIEYKQVAVKRTNQDLFQKYSEGVKNFHNVSEMLSHASNKFSRIQMQVIHSIYQVKESLMTLDLIAHRSNPLTCVDYIDQLIISEKTEMKPGWDARIVHLEDAKKQAHRIDQIKKGEFCPWNNYEKEIENEIYSFANVGNEIGTKKDKKWYNFFGIFNYSWT